MAEETYMSLAEMASQSTDDVATLTSRTPPGGVFHVKCKSFVGKEGESVDGKPPLHRYNIGYEVLIAKPVDKNLDPEALVGRTFTESYTFWPSDLAGTIGLLKGRFQKVGLPNQGHMGGVEGGEPGWADGAIEAEFDIQIRTAIKDGEPRAFYDWIKPDAKRWEQVDPAGLVDQAAQAQATV